VGVSEALESRWPARYAAVAVVVEVSSENTPDVQELCLRHADARCEVYAEDLHAKAALAVVAAHASHSPKERLARGDAIAATSAPGLGSPRPHLRQDRAPGCNSCTGTGLTTGSRSGAQATQLYHPLLIACCSRGEVL
jgi:hypothetical protein